jgi:hypothetical protein
MLAHSAAAICMIRLACSTAKDIQQMRGLSTSTKSQVCAPETLQASNQKAGEDARLIFGEIHADHWLRENAFYE